ncbi:hypothetical protein Tco_0519979 [Tanacetum coccineum]
MAKKFQSKVLVHLQLLWEMDSIQLATVNWLSTLGDSKFNFKDLKMEFVDKGRKMTLIGTQKTNMEWMSGKEQSKVVRQGNHAKLSSMQLCAYPEPTIQLWNIEGLTEEMSLID